MKKLLASMLLVVCGVVGCEPLPAEVDPNAPKLLVHLTTADFNQTIEQSDRVVLVDFWAPWCGPCRAMEPAIEAIARKHQDRLLVGKVNVDEEPDLAQAFQIEGIPALLVFQHGEMVEYLVGGRSQEDLEQALAPYLSSGPAPR